MVRFLIVLVLAVALVAGLAWLRRHHPARFLPGLIAGALLLGGVLWLMFGPVQGERLPFPAAAVRLEQLALAPAGGSWRLQGSVGNDDAQRGLDRLSLRLVVEDCPPAGCALLYDGTHELRVSLPPGGRRTFFLVFPATGRVEAGAHLRWRVEPGAATAYVVDTSRP